MGRLGKYLYKHRNTKGLKYRSASALIDMNESVIFKIERGHIPTIKTLTKIADGYGIDVMKLLEKAVYDVREVLK